MLYIYVDVLLNIHKIQNELEMIINVTVDAPDLKTKCKCAVYEEMFLCYFWIYKFYRQWF